MSFIFVETSFIFSSIIPFRSIIIKIASGLFFSRFHFIGKIFVQFNTNSAHFL